MKEDEASHGNGSVIESRLELLQGISIFYTLSDHELRRLARKAESRRVAAGTVVQKQGETIDRIVIVESGRCEVRARWAPGHSVTVALLSPGDFFGISSVVAGDTPDATVTATEATDLLEIHHEAIDAVLTAGSAARKELLRLAEQRRSTIADLIVRAQTVAPEQHGMVVAIYSVKGGSGKTSLAVNLAAALGSRHRGEVVLLDLGLPYNHAALVANLVPTGCLALAEKLGEERFEEAVLSSCLHHPLGMMVLPSALRVEQSELITPHLVMRAIDVLERTFSFIVVDLSIAITEMTLGVLERAGRIMLVVTPELPSLKDTAELLDIFADVLKIPTGNVTLVLNQPRPRTMVGRSDAERVIGRKTDVEIPNDGPRFDRAAVTGQLLIAGAPSSPPAKAIQRLAELVARDRLAHAR
ncbi:MAG TPA: cyclic nucleotide-binding domain-containing protein, partial [Candidatus Dormibacteraeota bacterium]|nr:cyclic nucleotide-binding domain-containing protein [Candidatus Dormibacteraeota bacterium]